MKILLLGDVMLGENMFHLNRGIPSLFRNKYDQLISPEVIKQLFHKCNIVFYNMEYSINTGPELNNLHPNKRIYVGEKDSISFINKNKTIVCNIANNHFSQHGPYVSNKTKNILQSNGIHITGDSNDPLEMSYGKHKLFFWGYSLVKDPKYCNEYNMISFKELMSANKKMTKNENDFWIVSLHWGEEYISDPSCEQKEVARKLVDNGFDLIIGHHPHVIQPVEFYNNKLILYSLGNFIFDQNFSRETSNGLAVVADVNNLNNSSFFKTFQKKYRVINSVQMNTDDVIEEKKKNICNNGKSTINKIKWKKRIEYLINFHKTHFLVIPLLIKKRLSKIFY